MGSWRRLCSACWTRQAVTQVCLNRCLRAMHKPCWCKAVEASRLSSGTWTAQAVLQLSLLSLLSRCSCSCQT